ncbi:MAG: M17 family peptidase N-terminal domain-containing protein [Nitrospiria bacterium]
MRVDVYSGSLSRLATEALVVTCFEDIRPLCGLAGEVDWFYHGVFSRLIQQSIFRGALGRAALIPTEGKLEINKTVLMGLGKSTAYGPDQFDAAIQRIIETLSDLNIRAAAVEMDLLTSFSPSLETTQEAASRLSCLGATHVMASGQLTLVMRDVEQANRLRHSLQSGNRLNASVN